jgi:hypothetical protein
MHSACNRHVECGKLYNKIVLTQATRGQMKALIFTVLQPSFTIHRLEPDAQIPITVFTNSFYSISKTDKELSIVAPDSVMIETSTSNPGWRALEVAGPLDFALTGILAQIATTLAQENISIFAISTFDTDYILVKSENLLKAEKALVDAGHIIRRPSKKNPGNEDSKKLEHDLLPDMQIQQPVVDTIKNK